MPTKRDFPNTAERVGQYGKMAVDQMKNRLVRAGKGGGPTEANIKFKIVYFDDSVEAQFRFDPASQYIEQGRKAYGSNRKHDPPVVKNWSRSRLKKWMAKKGIPESRKFAIARKIGRDGIEPYPFRFVTNTLWLQFRKRYEVAIAKDFELQLQRFVRDELRAR